MEMEIWDFFELSADDSAVDNTKFLPLWCFRFHTTVSVVITIIPKEIIFIEKLFFQSDLYQISLIPYWFSIAYS